MKEEDDKTRIDKLIEFFKTQQKKKPAPGPADYSSWDQTEEEYQKQQAEWMESVRRKKQKVKTRHKKD